MDHLVCLVYGACSDVNLSVSPRYCHVVVTSCMHNTTNGTQSRTEYHAGKELGTALLHARRALGKEWKSAPPLLAAGGRKVV